MPEYKNVEQPFLDKLRQLGWEVIDHGASFIPQNPSTSKRNSFREVILEDVFRRSIKLINVTEDGKEWLTDKQIDDVYRELTLYPGKQMLEVNRAVHKLLTKNTTVAINLDSPSKSL
ncbi:MAG: type I restriction endonuclease [Dehalococcoidales bacterium]|nr:type I restriction endonuclease [Dehalococcoidales bacterium]